MSGELTVHERGLDFIVREGTSDAKTVKEVVGRNAYRRRGFELMSKSWVDIGANVGAFTCLVASMGARVVAYEPDPDSFEMLRRNVEKNRLTSRVELVNAAVVATTVKSIVLHRNSANGNHWRNSTVKSWRDGTDVEVPAVQASAVWDQSADCKLDAEGAEMPLLEALVARPAARLVFEWSFDIDRSIPRFTAVVDRLRGHYSDVRFSDFDRTLPEWPGSWFPPCRTVWCT